MNTQLVEKQIEQALPLEQALEQLLVSYHADNADVQELSESATKLSEENSFLKLQIKTLTGRIDNAIYENEQLLEARKNDETKEKDFNKKAELVQANAEKHMQMLQQKDRELIQAKTQLEDSKSTLQAYKEIANTPKKVREKIKALQNNVATQQGFVTQHKLAIKSLEREKKQFKENMQKLSRQLDELDYTKVYSKNGDNIAIYPILCGTNIGQKEEKQVPLLYMTDDGIGALYMLNEDGEPARSPTPRTGIKPKAETLELMGTLLRKFKRNGNVVHSDDVKMLEVA